MKRGQTEWTCVNPLCPPNVSAVGEDDECFVVFKTGPGTDFPDAHVESLECPICGAPVRALTARPSYVRSSTAGGFQQALGYQLLMECQKV